MKRINLIINIMILLSALIIIARDLPVRSVLRNISYDVFQKLAPRVYETTSVRIIDIDDESLHKYGQWPWPRDRLAVLIDRLREMGASAIVFDIMFAEPDRTSPACLAKYLPAASSIKNQLEILPDHDQIFKASISRGAIVMGFSGTSGTVVAAASLPAVKARFVTMGDDPVRFLFPFKGAITTIASLEEGAAGNGSFNYFMDHDGIIRHVPLLVRIGDHLYPSLAVEALRVSQGVKNIVVKSSDSRAGRRWGLFSGIESIRIGNDIIFTDSGGEVMLHYAESVKERYIPAWRILSGPVSSREIRDNILFVGTSAKGLMDYKVSPLSGVIPGVEIHAQLVEQMLQQTYLHNPGWTSAVEVLFILLITFIVMRSASKRGPAFFTFMAAGSIAIYSAGAWLAFIRAKLFIDPLFPSAVLLLIFTSTGLTGYLRTERQRAWISKAFSSYVSTNLVQYLIKHPETLKLGGETRQCSFIFTDLTGFTSLMERHKPSQVVALLNGYIDGMLTIGFKYDATIDRVVGDSIAFIFSAPVVQPDHGSRAVECALALDAFATQFSMEKKILGIQLGVTRIGVHTGNVLVGNFGGKMMFDYRAIGDPINTCSRLETVNKHLGTRICISRETRQMCPHFVGRPVGILVLKGKTKGIEAYEPLSRDQWNSPGVKAYMHAYGLLEKNDPEAESAFEALTKNFPEDSLAAFHHMRLNSGETGLTVVLGEK